MEGGDVFRHFNLGKRSDVRLPVLISMKVNKINNRHGIFRSEESGPPFPRHREVFIRIKFLRDCNTIDQ